MIATSVAGLGSVYAGVLSLKNVIKTFKTFSDPKSSGPIPWLAYGLQSILEGGLAVGLAAPFLKIKSPFAKIINGKEVVQLKTIMAATFAPVILSLAIGIAQNNSAFTKIPLVGKPLQEIASSVAEGLKQVSSNTGDQNGAGQAQPQLPNLGG